MRFRSACTRGAPMSHGSAPLHLVRRRIYQGCLDHLLMIHHLSLA